MALPNNPRDQYLRTQVETASKEQLVVMLFDGIVRFTEVARKAIEEKRIEDSHHALMRAQAIVMELLCTVDKERGGDVAKNLMGLHAYAFNCLITCNMKKDISKIDEVQKIYRQLREGWVGAMDTLGIGAAKAAAAGAVPVANAKPAPARPAAAPVPPKPTGAAPVAKAPAAAAPAPQANPYPSKGPGGLLARNKPLGAPAAAPKPVILGAPKPAGLGGIPTMPKPAMPAAPKAVAPVAPTAAPAAAKPIVPAQPAQSAAAISYGMNRTASMMGAYGKAATSAPAQPAVIPTPVASAQPAAAPVTPVPVIKPVINAKQAAMLNAYQAKARTSA